MTPALGIALDAVFFAVYGVFVWFLWREVDGPDA